MQLRLLTAENRRKNDSGVPSPGRPNGGPLGAPIRIICSFFNSLANLRDDHPSPLVRAMGLLKSIVGARQAYAERSSPGNVEPQVGSHGLPSKWGGLVGRKSHLAMQGNDVNLQTLSLD